MGGFRYVILSISKKNGNDGNQSDDSETDILKMTPMLLPHMSDGLATAQAGYCNYTLAGVSCIRDVVSCFWLSIEALV